MNRDKAGMVILALCSFVAGCGSGSYNVEAARRNGVIVYYKGLGGFGTMEEGAMQAARELDMASIDGFDPMARKLVVEARDSVYGPQIAGHSSGASGAWSLTTELGARGVHFFDASVMVDLPLKTPGDPEVFNYLSSKPSIFSTCTKEAIVDGQRRAVSSTYYSDNPNSGHVNLPSQWDVVAQFERNIQSCARERVK